MFVVSRLCGLIEELVLDDLAHNTIEDLSGYLARILRGLDQLVLGLLLGHAGARALLASIASSATRTIVPRLQLVSQVVDLT